MRQVESRSASERCAIRPAGISTAGCRIPTISPSSWTKPMAEWIGGGPRQISVPRPIPTRAGATSAQQVETRSRARPASHMPSSNGARLEVSGVRAPQPILPRAPAFPPRLDDENDFGREARAYCGTNSPPNAPGRERPRNLIEAANQQPERKRRRYYGNARSATRHAPANRVDCKRCFNKQRQGHASFFILRPVLQRFSRSGGGRGFVATGNPSPDCGLSVSRLQFFHRAIMHQRRPRQT